MITATPTPRSAQASTACTALLPGTAMIARSGAAGRSARLAKDLWPWISGRVGLIG
jgi:hypothetical protein